MANLNGGLGSVKKNPEVVQLVELGNGVVQITMKDEQHHNTFSPGIIEGLYKCFGAVAQNKSYKVVILTGYGNYFSSGATKEHLIGIHKREIKLNDSDFFKLVLDCKIPVISAMQGHGIGGGFLLGLYADFIVLSQESIYTIIFMKYGFTPVGATSFILPNKLGAELAQEMMYTARNYRGEELAKRGIPVTVVPRKDVLSHALRLANEIAGKPRLSLVTLKEHLNLKIREKLPEFINKELEMHEITFHQPEVASRIETFFGEPEVISSKLHNLSQTWVNEAADIQNQVSLRQEILKNSPSREPFQLKISRYGLLKNLTLVPLERRIPGSTEVEIQIKAVPVNFRDILNALGMLQEYNEKIFGMTSALDVTFGFEGSGTIVAVGSEVSQWQVGDEVIVPLAHDAFSSFVIYSADNLLAKPSNLNMVEAATIPITFFTAYYGLHNLAKIQPGERVLIHAASGGVGQAAVQLAQLFGAEVFATTSNPSKMTFLREQGIKHVMNSRTTEFASEVMEVTQGYGVDVILNSLTHGEYIQKNIDILAHRGRYLEIGKLNIWSHEQVHQRRPDVKYFPFDLSEEYARDNQLVSQLWGDLTQHFEYDRLKPLPYKTFPIEDIVEAFRYMQHSKHIGKVVITMPNPYCGGEEAHSDRLPNREQIPQLDEVLHQLQSGEISLENAEKMLLGITEEEGQETATPKKKIDNDPNKLFNKDRTEEILSQLSTGKISLEKAESFLLEVVELEPEAGKETDINKKKNNKNRLINSENSEEILSLLSAGEISLENAENVLLEVVESESPREINGLTPVQNDIATTDIAIIGISCRYPGAKNWKEFWENLKNGVDSVTEPPPGRWSEKNWYHPDREHPGTSYSKSAGFLDEIDKFDPLFFQISPGEAQLIEPQQRIFLEEAYHAIEDAGYAADSLKGKQCGVFVGGAKSDYSKLLSNSGLGTHRLAGSGNLLSILPARIAYFLDLRGPVVAVDTACSSSLVAVHQACESIQRGESEIALAGGIATMVTADFQILSSQFQMVSPEGRCKTFDNSASGTVWSEGCGVVFLKSYARAIQDNDHIYGVIKGAGMNYDGKTNGISAPSSKSQTRLEAAVYQKFGINPETISYVEAHGTATPLGDPIEVEALTEAFSKWTNKKQFCAIGSVKTNIGHPSYAAGVAGLIKTILCLKNQKLVPSLHFNQPNPHIDFENSPFYVNTEFKDWEVPDGKPRRAAVSSFGFSGTNAHVVLEEAPIQESEVKVSDLGERPCHILTLSAKCEQALQELAQRYEEFIENKSTVELTDICFTANTGRSHFPHRLAIVAESTEELQQKLRAWKTGEETYGVVKGQGTDKKGGKIAFLFTGQGSQYIGMGRELYETQPTFRKTIEQCSEILNSYLERPLLDVLYPQPGQNSPIDETAYTQPALFAIEYALYQLWKSWGIEPDLVMGHSVGEYVAATVAGVFSLEDGLKLIAHRGRLMQSLPQDGAMVSLLAEPEQVIKAIQPYEREVAIAAFNGARSIVISGKREAVFQVAEKFDAQGVKTKTLKVSHGFHSPLMEPMLEDFARVARQVTYSPPQIDLISNVTGELATEEIATPEYWCNHILQPVKFAQGMATLAQQDCEILLEIGSKPILLGMGRLCLSDLEVAEEEDREYTFLPSLRPQKPDWQQMLTSLGELYLRGIALDWQSFEQDYPQRSRVVLPTYPFQRQRYWIKNTQNHEKVSDWTPVLSLLHQGKIQQVKSQLETAATLSTDEIKLLPKLLELIANKHQQQRTTVSNIRTNSYSDRAIANSNIEIEQEDKHRQRDELLAAPAEERRQLLKLYFGQLLAKVIEIKPSQLDWQESLSSVGLDSLMATELRREIEKQFNISIPAEFLAELNLEQFLTQLLFLIEKHHGMQNQGNSHSNSKLTTVTEITTKKKVKDNLWVIRPRPNPQDSLRLLCFPYAGAGASIFHTWAKELPAEIELCAIQLPGRESRIREAPLNRLKEVIKTLVPLLKPYLDCPFALFGHSMGALLSFELIRELRRQNYPLPVHLFVSGKNAPQLLDLKPPIHRLPDPEFIEKLKGYNGTPDEILQDTKLMQQFLPALRADMAILETYFYQNEAPLSLPITAFGGLEDPEVSRANLAAWEKQTDADFAIQMFAGDHFFLNSARQELLRAISTQLEQKSVDHKLLDLDERIRVSATSFDQSDGDRGLIPTN